MQNILGKYGLRGSTEEDASEAEMSIAYQRLKSSFEDDKCESGMKAQKMKEFLMVKDKYNIFGNCHQSKQIYSLMSFYQISTATKLI